MRIFELTAHLQKFSRSQGRSATAAAAYRSCSAIACERERVVHDYRAKAGLEACGIVLPEGAPAWASDRAKLWNAAELRERNGQRGGNAGAFKARAVIAREIMFGFPAELSQAARIEIAEIVGRHLAATYGIAADFAIHLPGREGDQRNHHCHMMLTSRRLTEDGLGAKAREWDSFKTGSHALIALRAFLADTMNAALAREGKEKEVFVEHRSLKARGSSRQAQKHMGPGKTHALRTTITRERVAWERSARDSQAARHEAEREQPRNHSPEAAASLDHAHRQENDRLEKVIVNRRRQQRAAEAAARQHYAEQVNAIRRARSHEQGRSRTD